jgi:TolA-binding protein
VNAPTGGGRRLRRACALVLVVLSLSSSGCAYYNTFYLAKRYYKEALVEEQKNTTDRVAPAASASYEKAIKQCARVLQRYRNSKWVDDALLLTGKSFYGQGNYGEARRWLTQLVNEQPNSPLVPEARVWIGRTWLAEEDFEKSGEMLRGVLAEVPQFEGRGEALFFAAETELRQENWQEAIAAYRELIERYPKSDRLGEALLRVGDAQVGLRQYADAERSYRQSAARAREPRARMRALLKVGQTLEKQERFEEATRLYDGLSAELVPRDKLNTILSGFDAALPSLPGGTGAVNSGLTEQQQIQQNSYVDAQGNTVFPNPNVPRENFPNNVNPVSGSDPAGTPQAPPDPRRTGEGNAAARGALSLAVSTNPLAADLPLVLLRQGTALMEMGEYDKAIRTFESVLAASPRTSEAGEAQYRIGYILEVYLEDYAGARVAYDLVKLHGTSLFVEQAARRSGGLERLVALAAQDSSRAEGVDASLEAEAEKQFLAAELAWFQQEKPDKAIEMYADVERKFPGTSFAVRSALARAWLLTNVLEDTTAGRAAFESIAATYPETEQGRIAHQILTGEVIQAADAPDSLAIAAFEDSLLRAEAQADSQAALAAREQAMDAMGDSLRAAASGDVPVTEAVPVPVAGSLTMAAASDDSLSAALAREEARRRSEAEARALAESADAGNGAAVAQAVSAEELARLGIQRAPDGTAVDSPVVVPPAATAAAGETAALDDAATGAPPGTTPASGAVPTTGAASPTTTAAAPARPPSRLAPESATGLPKPFSARRPARGPTTGRPVRQRSSMPAPTPSASDTTGGGGRGRTVERAWH